MIGELVNGFLFFVIGLLVGVIITDLANKKYKR